MRAAVLTGPGQLVVKDVPPPRCPPGGVLLRVQACGLCSADLKMWRLGHKELEMPRILGHEVAGVVLESDRPELPAGTMVQVAPGVPCGSCPACRGGAHNRCPEVKVLGFSLDGGLAELMAVPAQGLKSHTVTPLPVGIEPFAATLAEPLACVLNAWQQAKLLPGEKVLVIGAGPVGRLAAWAAKDLGARTVLVTDRDPQRLKKMDGIGMTFRMDGVSMAAQKVLESGVDVVLPACSDPQALTWGLKALKPGGRLVVFSGLKEAAHLDPNQIHYRELTLVGAYGCTAKQNRQALASLAAGTPPLDLIISHRMPLSRVSRGLELIERRESLKIVINPQEE